MSQWTPRSTETQNFLKNFKFSWIHDPEIYQLERIIAERNPTAVHSKSQESQKNNEKHRNIDQIEMSC